MMTKTPAPTIGTARYCAVTLRHEDPDGFYNTQHVLDDRDPHVWISATGARELAKAEGWTSPEARAALEARIGELEAQLAAAIDEISEQRKRWEQINGLATAGMEVVKSPGGRPTRNTRPEVIRDELKAAA